MIANDQRHWNVEKSEDRVKPGKMFDDDTTTYYHARYSSSGPGVRVYFGYETEVSEIKITNRIGYQPYYDDLANTVVSVIVVGGKEVHCGTLTNVNTDSDLVEDQTYTIFCGNKRGIGVSLQKQGSAQGWCISELKIYHFTGLFKT